MPRVGIWRSLKLCNARVRRCAVAGSPQALPSYIRCKHPLLRRTIDARQGYPCSVRSFAPIPTEMTPYCGICGPAIWNRWEGIRCPHPIHDGEVVVTEAVVFQSARHLARLASCEPTSQNRDVGHPIL